MNACCIAGGGLYRGIGAYLGMDVLSVEGATALPDTSLTAKFNAARKALESYDFVFVHIKAADSLGEDGNYSGKVTFIERVDAALESVRNWIDSTLLVITADHSTPCALKTHSADSVPVLFHGYGVRRDEVETFGERAVWRGGLGFFNGRISYLRFSIVLVDTVSTAVEQSSPDEHCRSSCRQAARDYPQQESNVWSGCRRCIIYRRHRRTRLVCDLIERFKQSRVYDHSQCLLRDDSSQPPVAHGLSLDPTGGIPRRRPTPSTVAS